MLLMWGCGTLYELDIAARNAEAVVPEGSYVLLPVDPNVSVSSDEFLRYTAYIERGLSKHYPLSRLPVADIAEADMAILVHYRVGDEETVGYTNTVPMFQTTSPVAPDDSPRSKNGSGNSGQTNSGGRSTVDPPPQQELIGTQTYTFVRTVYWRDLSLRAIRFDWQPEETPSVQKTADLWNVSVATQGSSADLDEVMPVLVAAAIFYVGQDHDGLMTEKMNGIDRRIKEIREVQ